MKRSVIIATTAIVLAGAVGAASLRGAETLRASRAPEAEDSLPDHFGIGRTATAAELAKIDVDVRADGRGLPSGSGTPEIGAKLYAARCIACHGKNGEGIRQGTLQLGPKLIGRNPGDAFDFNQSTQKEGNRTIGNYWPYATTLFDYIRRAMPFDRPGSLTNDEVYALTAYLLEQNKIVDANAVIDAKTLPQVKMPSRDKFERDNRESVNVVR